MRMQIRRLTRLTNAFPGKWGNLEAAVALHLAFYNLCRGHARSATTLMDVRACAVGTANLHWIDHAQESFEGTPGNYGSAYT